MSINKERPFKSTKEFPYKCQTGIVPLKNIKNSLLIGNTKISPNCIEIVLDKGVNLYANDSKVKSYVYSLELIKKKDLERISLGQIKESEILGYRFELDYDGLIKKIIITNYWNNERLNSILFFTRMWLDPSPDKPDSI